MVLFWVIKRKANSDLYANLSRSLFGLAIQLCQLGTGFCEIGFLFVALLE